MEREMESNSNTVNLSGKVVVAPFYSHSAYGEDFYRTAIKSRRKSGNCDYIPVLISDRLCNMNEIKEEMLLEVSGRFRSYNMPSGNRTKLILNVFAADVFLLEQDTEKNEIALNGFICKEPVYRKTPRGREITDFLVAVNRPYGKSDYIPCICWGRNARFVSGLRPGDKFIATGRIQSREYVKTVGEKKGVQIAYEVSIHRIDLDN